MRRTSSFVPLLFATVASVVLFVIVNAQVSAAQTHVQSAVSPRPSINAVSIVRDPADVPPPVGNRAPTVVHVTLTAKEVVGQLDPATGATYQYWTFGGKVPGPMLRVRQGDTVEVTLQNDPSSRMVHSVDLHAALGPGGGAVLSQATPGQAKVFTFQATIPGLYVYHCGTPMVAEHISNGMYGLILVEPPGGLPPVEREYYLMQGELYTVAAKGKPGLQQFSSAKLMQEQPEYMVFNGAVDGVTKDRAMHANAGEKVRVFFGNAGPNNTSSLHVMGQIFTHYYELGSLASPPVAGVQTASVPPGGAALLELNAVSGGQYHFVDHAIARLSKGLMATLEIAGPQNAELMHEGPISAANAELAGGTGIFQGDPKSTAESSTATAAPVMMHAGPASSSTLGHDMGMSNMNHTASPLPAPVPGRVRAPRTATLQPAALLARPATTTELNGCLKLMPDGKAMLQLLGSKAVYRLEAQPLGFSQNSDRIIHVTGQFGTVLGSQNEDPKVPSFVVDSIEALAPDCSARITPAMLRKASAPAGEKQTGPAVPVHMSETGFTTPKIFIHAGQAIVWNNSSQAIHNVIADSGKAMVSGDVQLPSGAAPFGSGYITPGQSYSHVFTKPGIYKYVCTLHENNGMKGIIVVKE